MRKLVSLVGMALVVGSAACAGVIPSWESKSKQFGFYPISNELSVYRNVDDLGVNRGTTLQVISINSFKLFTEFKFEFTGDFNYDYTPGLNRDHYIELGLVKPLGSVVSLNAQRIVSTFEIKPINQFGVRLSF